MIMKKLALIGVLIAAIAGANAAQAHTPTPQPPPSFDWTVFEGD